MTPKTKLAVRFMTLILRCRVLVGKGEVGENAMRMDCQYVGTFWLAIGGLYVRSSTWCVQQAVEGAFRRLHVAVAGVPDSDNSVLSFLVGTCSTLAVS